MCEQLEWSDIWEEPTLVAVLEAEVLKALAKLAAELYRANTIIFGLVVECPVCQDYTFGIRVAALIDIIAVFWRNVRVTDVLEACCRVRIVCSGCLSRFCILSGGGAISLWPMVKTRTNVQSRML